MMELAVDPGSTGLGWATFLPEYMTVYAAGTHDPSGSNYLERSYNAACWVRKLILSQGVDTVYCEFPEFFQDARGHAAMVNGSALKLTYNVGQIAMVAMDCNCKFQTFAPTTWKGQLPKDAVEQRIRRYLGEDVCKRLGLRSHAWDAVGIGLFAKGHKL